MVVFCSNVAAVEKTLRRPWRVFPAAALTLLALILPVSSMTKKRLVILGFDGLDPTLLKTYMDQGKLPNMKRLAESGTFANLATSNPPQSPVAWSCFISGENPGEHDVFDFVVRNPKTYLPEIGMTEEATDKSAWKKIVAGLSGPSLKTRRKGPAFWDHLGKKGIKSIILRCPVTFPAEALQGRLISGMGTPDLRGTQGHSSFYSTNKTPTGEIHGKWVEVAWSGSEIKTEVFGPWVQSAGGRKEASIPMTITRLPNEIRLEIGDKKIVMETGRWSDWIPLQFKTGPFSTINGIVRFHLNKTDPFELFMTPVNIDPQNPALSISYPTDYAKEIFQKIGYYYTQGMPYDTWALNESRLSEEKFLEQAYSIVDENMKTLDMELGRFDDGLLFCYFGITDLVQHMFWRYHDSTHPAEASSTSSAVREAIPNVYKKADDIVGHVVSKLPEGTGLLVMSDHGFGSFRRAAHLNSWLRKNGYLELQGNAKEGKEFFTNVDWSQTQAYSVGFGGIYINQFDREKNGIVYKGAETENLKSELIGKLTQWKDENGRAVIKKVYRKEELYQGPRAENGPDLYVGFNLPYRASWQTGLGAAPAALIEDNARAWSGDHLCDPDLVPGVFLSSSKTASAGLSITNLSSMILHFFGVDEK